MARRERRRPKKPGYALRCRPELLQNSSKTFISRASSLEPGRICMMMCFSQIVFPRPKPMPDACIAL